MDHLVVKKQWHRDAIELKKAGHTFKSIARLLELDPRTIGRYFHPEWRAKDLAQQSTYRKTDWFRAKAKEYRTRKKVLECARFEAERTGKTVDQVLERMKQPARPHYWRLGAAEGQHGEVQTRIGST